MPQESAGADPGKRNRIALPKAMDTYQVVDGRPHLVGTKCPTCQAAFFPPRHVCPTCLTDGMHTHLLGNTGTLYAHTVIWAATKDFNPPYPFGYIIVEPENVRIPAMIAGVSDFSTLETGMKMEMVLDKLRTDDKGQDVITYKFRPISNSGTGRQQA